MTLCYERDFNSLNYPSNRTYGAGQTHVWLCPKFLVTYVMLLVYFIRLYRVG